MSDFDFVQTVEHCCCFIDLKVGAIIIAIIGLLDHTDVGLVTYYPICADSTNHIVTLLKTIFNCISIVAAIAIFITSLVFLFGIFKEIKATAVWFMYAILFSLIVRILYLILIVVLGFTFSGCHVLDFNILNKIIGFLIWYHFLSVVKSYKEEM